MYTMFAGNNFGNFLASTLQFGSISVHSEDELPCGDAQTNG